MEARRLITITISLFVTVLIYGVAFAGGTVTITSVGSVAWIGDDSNAEYIVAQSIKPVSGTITQFTFNLGANDGSPSSGIYWELAGNNDGVPGSMLLEDYIETPLQSSTNTVSGLSGVYVDGATLIWLVLSTDPQSTNVRYNWVAQSGTYADGQRCFSSDGGDNWTCDGYDQAMSITTTDPTPTPTATATTTPEPTATSTIAPTLGIGYLATLESSGEYYLVDRYTTFGDIGIFAALLLIAAISLLSLFIQVIHGRANG